MRYNLQKINSKMTKALIFSIASIVIITLIISCSSTKDIVKKENRLVHGYVDPHFESVREEFTKNIIDRGEIGAACAVYYNGNKIVDLWGGYRNKKKTQLWNEHTFVRSWSTSKGIGAVCLGILHSRGLLDYDKPISFYWPSFAKHGKDLITVRQLLAQQAGLCLLNKNDAGKYSFEDLKNHDTASKILENIIPIWEPGTYYGYHGGSEGLFIGELIYRIDPAHRSMGKFFQDEIAIPLGLNYYIGLPETIPDSCLAETVMASPLVALSQMKSMPPRLRKAIFNSKSIFMRSMSEIKGIELNSRKYLAFEDVGGNGIGEPRAIAAIYNELLQGGSKINITKQTVLEFEKPATYPPSGKLDTVMGIIMPTSLGFMKPDSGSAFYTKSKRAYGFFGANGSLGFADPELNLAISYGGNYHGFHMSKHEDIIIKEVYKCIQRLKNKVN